MQVYKHLLHVIGSLVMLVFSFQNNSLESKLLLSQSLSHFIRLNSNPQTRYTNILDIQKDMYRILYIATVLPHLECNFSPNLSL